MKNESVDVREVLESCIKYMQGAFSKKCIENFLCGESENSLQSCQGAEDGGPFRADVNTGQAG